MEIYTRIKNALQEKGVVLDEVIYNELVADGVTGAQYDPLTWEDVLDEFFNHADRIGIETSEIDAKKAAHFIIEAKEQFCPMEDGQYADEACEYIAHLALQRTAMTYDLIPRTSYDEIARENGELAFNVIPVAMAVAAEEKLVTINISGDDLKDALIAACTSYHDEAGNGVGAMMDAVALLDPELVAYILDAAQEQIKAGANALASVAVKRAIREAGRAGKGWDTLIAIR